MCRVCMYTVWHEEGGGPVLPCDRHGPVLPCDRHGPVLPCDWCGPSQCCLFLQKNSEEQEEAEDGEDAERGEVCAGLGTRDVGC